MKKLHLQEKRNQGEKKMGKDSDNLVGFILLLLGAAVVGKIISDATKKSPYYCPRCSREVFQNQDPCPHCQSPLRWS